MADAFALSRRCVLHLDLDSFFLSVHKRRDPTLPLDTKPVVLYQFQDVICANRRAKTLGVKKHMRPREARALVESSDGLVMHAFCRDWPGPRVRYSPYNAASREFFDALDVALRNASGGEVPAIERWSIDEGFVELAKPRDPAAFCSQVRAAVESATGLRVTVGCGPNKLLAKLASSAAKGTPAAVRIVDGDAAVETLLSDSPASRLPGLSNPPASAKTICDLRSCAELDEKLRVKTFGRDDATLKCTPPKTAQVASWTAHTEMATLCRRGESDAAAVAFPARRGGGSWCFEPHATDGTRSSELTRPRWVVLALCIDLEERLRHDAALYRRRPTRLTLTIRYPGTDPLPIPGNNYISGGSKSRSVPFPAPRPSPPDEAAALTKAICGGVESEAVDVPADAYGRIHALVDAVAAALEGWSREQSNPRVAHLSLSAGHFDSGPAPVPITALFKASPKKKRPAPPPAPTPPPPSPVRARPTPASPDPVASSPGFAGIDCAEIDPATLAELPADVRADVERQMRLWQGSRKRPGGASPSPQKRPAPSTPSSKNKRSPTKSPKITSYLPASPAAPAPAPDTGALDQILAMGFGPNRAQRALNAADGDAQRAIDTLLGGG